MTVCQMVLDNIMTDGGTIVKIVEEPCKMVIFPYVFVKPVVSTDPGRAVGIFAYINNV